MGMLWRCTVLADFSGASFDGDLIVVPEKRVVGT